MSATRKKNKLVYGIGLNDADYAVGPKIDGRQIICPFYRVWRSMIERCYDHKSHAKYPTYICCSVCPEWLRFSAFKAWMEAQEWQGKALDKDLLIPGNKIYSPAACAFVDPSINSFLTDSAAIRGKFPIGVNLNKPAKKYQASCNNQFIKKKEHLGLFDCPVKAHEAWRARKHELACQLADKQTDQRIANALRTRFLTNLAEAA